MSHKRKLLAAPVGALADAQSGNRVRARVRERVRERAREPKVADAVVKALKSCNRSKNACAPACRANNWDPRAQRHVRRKPAAH